MVSTLLRRANAARYRGRGRRVRTVAPGPTSRPPMRQAAPPRVENFVSHAATGSAAARFNETLQKTGKPMRCAENKIAQVAKRKGAAPKGESTRLTFTGESYRPRRGSSPARPGLSTPTALWDSCRRVEGPEAAKALLPTYPRPRLQRLPDAAATGAERPAAGFQSAAPPPCIGREIRPIIFVMRYFDCSG